MAKHNLFLGQARGKIGSVVFSRLRGVQVSRAYNPSPANPRTDAQSRQRAFFASVSQYYKSFRYLIEQGQEGVQTGQLSVQNWQSRALRELAATYGSRPMLLNAKGVQWPQLIPVSLTHGSLESVDYAILGRDNSAGDRKFFLAMLFRQRYESVAALQAMTLGDFYALYPSYQRGIQLTFAALGYSVDYSRTDLGNIQAQPVWCQYVIAPDADETLPFFVSTGVGEQMQINPAILSSSWGERFNPRWSMYLSEDGYAYAAVSDAAFFTDGSGGMVAGSVITSYFDGTRWARSTSPMDYADTFVMVDNSNIINTYKSAAKSNKSDLYLNQAKTASINNLPSVTSVRAVMISEGGSIVDEKTFTTLGGYANLKWPSTRPTLSKIGLIIEGITDPSLLTERISETTDEESVGQFSAYLYNDSVFFGFDFSEAGTPEEDSEWTFEFSYNGNRFAFAMNIIYR